MGCGAKIESDLSLIPWPSYHQESGLQNRSGSSMGDFHVGDFHVSVVLLCGLPFMEEMRK